VSSRALKWSTFAVRRARRRAQMWGFLAPGFSLPEVSRPLRMASAAVDSSGPPAPTAVTESPAGPESQVAASSLPN